MYCSMAILHSQKLETPMWWGVVSQWSTTGQWKIYYFCQENQSHKNMKQNKSDINSASYMTPFIWSSKTGKNEPTVAGSQASGYPCREKRLVARSKHEMLLEFCKCFADLGAAYVDETLLETSLSFTFMIQAFFFNVCHFSIKCLH